MVISQCQREVAPQLAVSSRRQIQWLCQTASRLAQRNERSTTTGAWNPSDGTRLGRRIVEPSVFICKGEKPGVPGRSFGAGRIGGIRATSLRIHILQPGAGRPRAAAVSLHYPNDGAGLHYRRQPQRKGHRQRRDGKQALSRSHWAVRADDSRRDGGRAARAANHALKRRARPSQPTHCPSGLDTNALQSPACPGAPLAPTTGTTTALSISCHGPAVLGHPSIAFPDASFRCRSQHLTSLLSLIFVWLDPGVHVVSESSTAACVRPHSQLAEACLDKRCTRYRAIQLRPAPRHIQMVSAQPCAPVLLRLRC